MTAPNNKLNDLRAENATLKARTDQLEAELRRIREPGIPGVPPTLHMMIEEAAALCEGVPNDSEYMRAQVELIYNIQTQPWLEAVGMDGDMVRGWIKDAIDVLIGKNWLKESDEASSP